jgi:serine/threonine protein kinase
LIPEYGLGNEVSMQGDVYSYGILLLEVFTGKRPTDNEFGEGLGLRKYVEIALPGRVTSVVDRHLVQETEDGEGIADMKNFLHHFSSTHRGSMFRGGTGRPHANE